MNEYVLDACALVAYFNREEGWNELWKLLRRTAGANTKIRINAINLLEVYYGYCKSPGQQYADRVFDIISELQITVNNEISNTLLKHAAYLKTKYGRMSLADAILLAEASVNGGTIVTADHKELDKVDIDGEIDFEWFR
ncbi:MAG: PIN domain-containing protein [Oscillospiraceae bacterium]|nr:PIN domain-containing protein [Oscillospiraceae bacterium]